MGFELAAFAGIGPKKCTRGKVGSRMATSSVLTTMSRTWPAKNTIDSRFIACSFYNIISNYHTVQYHASTQFGRYIYYQIYRFYLLASLKSLNLDDTPKEILYGYGINISRYG